MFPLFSQDEIRVSNEVPDNDIAGQPAEVERQTHLQVPESLSYNVASVCQTVHFSHPNFSSVSKIVATSKKWKHPRSYSTRQAEFSRSKTVIQCAYAKDP